MNLMVPTGLVPAGIAPPGLIGGSLEPDYSEIFRLDHPPCRVLQELLGDQAVEWSFYSSYLPDTPDKAAAVFDTTPILESRIVTGVRPEHYGIAVLLRAPLVEEAELKAQELLDYLHPLHDEDIVVSTSRFRLKSITPMTGVVSLGIERNSERQRSLCSINFLVDLVGLELAA